MKAGEKTKGCSLNTSVYHRWREERGKKRERKGEKKKDFSR